MQTFNNVHQQFASFFKSKRLQPFAYLVSKKISEGHICVALQDLHEDEDVPVFYENISGKDVATILEAEPLVTTAGGVKQPFVLHNHKLYLQRYFNYETIILTRIRQLIAAEHQQLQQRETALLQQQALVYQLFYNDPMTAAIGNKTNWQLVAAISAILNNFTIITGGPGTGKTTTVAKMLALLYAIEPSCRVALAAPTGKAAARMAESLKAAASIDQHTRARLEKLVPATLHRLLKLSPGSVNARFNQQNPLEYDLIIVDESSMIDVSLFAKLLHATGDHTRLVMLGDKDQLASVEAGSLFGDLCKAQPQLNLFASPRAGVINQFMPSANVSAAAPAHAEDHPLFQHVIELQESHRFSGNEGIGLFSKAIINNDQPAMEPFFFTGFHAQVTIDTAYTESLFESFCSGYSSYISEPDIATALRKLNNLRVLCAVRAGMHGVYAVNKKIEILLQQKNLLNTRDEFYEHRPIIITRNYYDLQLFNGDTGIIRADENGVLNAWFLNSQQQLHAVLPGLVSEADTVFAMTIHKSQGSEFNQVLVLLPDTSEMALLTRELLYTAITRARKQVVIQGSKALITDTAQRSVKRVSGIVDRFREEEVGLPQH